MVEHSIDVPDEVAERDPADFQQQITEDPSSLYEGTEVFCFLFLFLQPLSNSFMRD